MNIKDFKVFACPDCGHLRGLYYMPPLSEDEHWRQRELEEYKRDFDIDFTDGTFVTICPECGKQATEVPFEEWTAEELKEAIGDVLEDDNRHSITGIAGLFEVCMEEAGAERNTVENALRKLAEYYSEHHSLNY